MKRSFIYSFLTVVIFGIHFSCVRDDDFSIPQIIQEEPEITVNTNIVSIKNLYNNEEPVLIEGSDLFMEAYVISSDESGNVYKQFFIQDLPENPTSGVVISTHATSLYTKYNPGQKIYFRVDGLYIGDFAGLPTIGIRDGENIGRISAEDFEQRIYRSLEKADIIPRVISIEDASNEVFLATLVQLEEVQFPEELFGEYYGNPNNSQTVNRILEDCDEAVIILRNSGFADFKDELLPEGNGTVVGLLSTFYGEAQLFIRDLNDVNLIGERCEPPVTDPLPGGVYELPFYENFENHQAGTGVPVNLEDWKNININNGNRVWEVREFSRNNYAQTSAFNSYENPYEVWLITPGLFLPEGSFPVLTFETKDGYYTGDALSVKISTDFDEDVLLATWTDLNAEFSRGNTSGYGNDFIPSGDIDLSEFAGEIVYIAFRYSGAQDGVTTTYQIDTIAVEKH